MSGQKIRHSLFPIKNRPIESVVHYNIPEKKLMRAKCLILLLMRLMDFFTDLFNQKLLQVPFMCFSSSQQGRFSTGFSKGFLTKFQQFFTEFFNRVLNKVFNGFLNRVFNQVFNKIFNRVLNSVVNFQCCEKTRFVNRVIT